MSSSTFSLGLRACRRRVQTGQMTSFSLDADTVVILISGLLTAGGAWGGWRLFRSGHRVLAVLLWLAALLAAFVAYFFATFTMRMM